MTAAQLNQLRALLLGLEKELVGKGPARIEPNRTDDARVGGDEDEQPLNEMMQAIASSRNRQHEGVQARVQKALAKLREVPDDFGLCEVCEEEIAFGRLKAMPYAELCLECQSKNDGPKGPRTRKNLTDYS